MESPKVLCTENRDRITELPRNVIDCIFDRMPIRDGARTCILSRSWRYIWASYPKLVFDTNFFNEIRRKHEHLLLYIFINAISKALLVHNGPVLKFVLHIPNILKYLDIPIDVSSDIHHWMLYLSRNGIKELELVLPSNPTPYVMPSSILMCNSLVELRLNNCMLKPPHAFEGFHYLVKLVLDNVSISASMSTTLLHNAVVLRTLIIRHSTGIEQIISIHAPMLNYISLVDNDKVDWQWYESIKQLRSLQINLGKEVKNVDRTISMKDFLKNIRNVQTLWLDGFSLKYLAAENPTHSLAPPRLPSASAPFLKNVRLLDFGVEDLDQISSAFCLLKSCPNLKSLELDVSKSTDNVDNVPEPITEYLEPSNCMNLRLDMLQTVKIRLFRGRLAELLFIKLLLARSTCLQKMIIEQSKLSTANGDSYGAKISRELLKFTRASSRAEIIHVIR